MDEPPLPNFEKRLGWRTFAAPTADVARQLLGKYLLRKLDSGQWIGGKIVETEAYLHRDDPASHSHRGQTRRNTAMFASPGVVYVYTIHAKHCMNFSTERNGVGAAVLIRALEPIWGLEEMQLERERTDLRKLTSGPAMLCQALSIDLTHNATELESADWLAVIAGEKLSSTEILVTSRIGIRRAADLPLRFVIAGTRFASRPTSRIETKKPTKAGDAP
jgi:DNA-3-methyladenine glycosylase